VSSLAPERVRPLLRGAFGDPLLYEAVCPSTQDLVLGRGLPEGAVAVADHQTAGRGRSGRAWEDAPGTALLCSVLLRPGPGVAHPELSLVAGLATAEAIEAAAGLRALVKWPNDVVLGGGKVAGVLLEAAAGEVACGIGVNVDDAPPAADATLPATSLRAATGGRHDRAAVLAGLLEALERRYRDWLAGGLERVHGDLVARHFLRGRAVRVGDDRGRAGTIAPDGRLELLLDSGGRRLVESGEVVLVGGEI
jgi:BirA family biotin operon repressor/biotin-[acetyl-CoA-carboxylase] ligase